MIDLYHHLANGDTSTVAGLFTDDHLAIDDQRAGQIDGAALPSWVTQAATWLRDLEAEVFTITTIDTPARVAVEYEIWISTADGRVDLPVVAVGDKDGDAISAIRTYHSTWPWTKAHRYRAPVLPDAPVELPAPVSDYIEGINNGEAQRCLDTFARTGYMQEASGSWYRHQGQHELADVYQHLTPGDRRIQILPRTCTTNGRNTIVEYDFTTPAETVAGAATFEQTPDRRLSAIRVCDDATL